MAKLYNLARMTTATTGTGTITLGSAVAGFLSFVSAGISDGDVITYAIQDGSNSEIGRGTYTASGTTLTRSVLKSTNSNALISLSGAAQVFITPAAEDLLTVDMPQVVVSPSSTLMYPDGEFTARTAVYVHPIGGGLVPIYDGSSFGMHSVGTTPVTFTLTSNSGFTGYHQSGKNFFLCVFNDSGTIRVGTMPAWTGDNSTGTGAGTSEVQWISGIPTNAVSAVVRWGTAETDTVTVAANKATIIGGFRTIANGQTCHESEPAPAAGGTNNRLFIDTVFHGQQRAARCRDSTDTWTYTTDTFRQANAGAGTNNAIAVFTCFAGRVFNATYNAFASNSGTAGMRVGVGFNSTTTPECAATNTSPSAGIRISILGFMTKRAANAGLNTVYPLEASAASGTTTWNGDNGGPTTLQMALFVTVDA